MSRIWFWLAVLFGLLNLILLGGVLIAMQRVSESSASSGGLPVGAADTASAPDIATFQQYMLFLINEERESRGLAPVAWDDTASQAALAHAREMAGQHYISHWNRAGYGPDYRYTRAGGMNGVRENIYLYQHRPGEGPTTFDESEQLIRRGHQQLMESASHRENILAPEHTHVGLGLAYDAANGWLLMTQEFVDRYVALQPISPRAKLGDRVLLAGRLKNGATRPVLNLAHEPLPQGMSVSELRETGGFSSPAANYKAIALGQDESGQFWQEIILNYQGLPGLYHLRVWVDTDFGKTLAADVVIQVE
jgi:uncharacterized protein YkwD